jgi:hypothetical protein
VDNGPAPSGALRSLALTPCRESIGSLSVIDFVMCGPMTSRRYVSVLLLSVAEACSGSGSDDLPIGELPGTDVQTIDTVQWMVGAEPILEIGRSPAPEYQLHDVGGATRLEDGRVVIANRGSSELRVYDRKGSYLESWGRDGDGPGEFRHLHVMRRLNDGRLVAESSSRLTWFSDTGIYMGSIQFLARLVIPECRSAEDVLLPSGRVLLTESENQGVRGCPPIPSGAHRHVNTVMIYDPLSEGWDTLGVFPGTERMGNRYAVLGLSLLTATSPNQVFLGDTGGDSILVYSGEGVRLGALLVPFERREIPAGVRAQDEVRWSNSLTGASGVRQVSYPDSFPGFGRLLADELGHVWVMRFPEVDGPYSSWVIAGYRGTTVETKDPVWRVQSLRSDAFAEVTTPRGFYPLEIGADYLLGIVKDELDVESVVMLPLDRGRAALNN